MFCSKCGAQVSGEAPFCGACGARIEGYEPPKAADPVIIKPQIPNPPKKQKKVRKPIAINTKKLAKVLVPVLVVALLAGALLAIFGKRTIYVQTESVSNANGQKTKVQFTYDEDGVLQSRESSNASSQTEYTYHYDSDGRIESLVVVNKVNGTTNTWELEYHYDDDGMLEKITGASKNGSNTMVAACDEGIVTEIEVFSRGGLIQHCTYSYHDNGILAVKEVENYNAEGMVVTSSVYECSESGKLLRSEQKASNGEVIMEMGYDRQDRLVAWTYITSYSDGSQTSITVTWRNNWRGRITDPVMEMEVLQNGGLESVTITGEVEWDGNKATITAGEVDDDNTEDFSMDGIEEVEVEVEYGDHGYITEMEVSMDGYTVISNSWEYTEVKVSRDYKEFAASDPYWCILWG